ncbi:MAG: DUF1552 domain-containing protein [Vicinamibacterales bacterium]
MNISLGKHISRRTVLRGAGVSLALPLLDAMVPAHVATRLTAAAPVRRFAAVYVPMGMNMASWTPAAEGPLELTAPLQALAPYKDKVLAITGLDHDPAVPKGQIAGQHSRVMASWLTGTRVVATEGPGFRNGTSLDQIIAQHAGDTQLRSMELALESVDLVGACEQGYTCVYSGTIAWRTPTTPLPMEVNPRVVFERMFGDTGSTDPTVRAVRNRKDRSLLDSVTAQVPGLQKTLAGDDRVKLDQYLDAVRDVEHRIQKAEEQSGRELPVMTQPAGVPRSYDEHAEVMFDLLALAFQTDLTRVATFMIGREMSVRTFPQIGISEPHHPLSHHQNNPEKLAGQAKLNAYHVRLFSHLVDRLAAAREDNQSILENSILLYGSGMSDSNIHAALNLPTLVVGGGAGQIRGGRHLTYPKATPLTNLQLAILDKMGAPVERFGDSNGRLDLLPGI